MNSGVTRYSGLPNRRILDHAAIIVASKSGPRSAFHEVRQESAAACFAADRRLGMKKICKKAHLSSSDLIGDARYLGSSPIWKTTEKFRDSPVRPFQSCAFQQKKPDGVDIQYGGLAELKGLQWLPA